MSFLTPTAIAWAAALTIPPLIALYFLKLKRTVHMVPSTMLWKRAVEDLQVNAPFQRLRSSLLLLLQLLVLAAAAMALGKPMFQTTLRHEGTVIILVDRSASMGVREASGKTRLELAKELATLCVDNLDDDARAMVIAFSDRAAVVSSFTTDKRALKREIDSIEPTQSTSSLEEALTLAEAYAQNIIIGTEEAGSEKAPEPAAPPATVFLFSDGRIEGADRVSLQRFDVSRIRMSTVGERGDNVGITAMDARRNYEQPELLEVAATVRNFGPAPVQFDAVLYVDGQNVDVQTIRLEPVGGGDDDASPTLDDPAAGSVGVLAFDEIEFGGGGVVEVVLRVDDALSADDRAWTIIQPPRHLRVLLVTPGNLFLENVLSTLPLELVKMTGSQYEAAHDKDVTDGNRSAFDVVIVDRHSTDRLPHGNYFFWGGVPKIEGVEAGAMIDNQVIFNWDDTHPILRHVAVETLFVYRWFDLKLPPEAVSLIDGETSPVVAYFTRESSQFLVSAFSLLTEDEDGNVLMNTQWGTSVDFVVFMQNAVNFLGSNINTTGRKSVRPGEPVTLPIPAGVSSVKVLGPDGVADDVTASGFQTIHYARTRRVGTYHVEPGVEGHDTFAVNLFNQTESMVEPASTLTLGAAAVASQAGTMEVNEPAWVYFLLAMLALLLLEWIIYNRRILV